MEGSGSIVRGEDVEMNTSAARQFADRYVEIINRGEYSKLQDLFAADAVFLAPGQQQFRGREEISVFYEQFLGEITPTIRIVSYLEQGNDCVYELEAITKDSSSFTLGAIDHATLNGEGKVVRFSVFTK
jgi:ketosteroid isomerase-like protein